MFSRPFSWMVSPAAILCSHVAHPRDANADGNVDLLDLDILGSNFGQSIDPALLLLADLNNDGFFVDDDDLDLLLMGTGGDLDNSGTVEQDELDLFCGWLGFRGVA